MEKMKLTHGDLKAMISEAVERTLSARRIVAESSARDIAVFKFTMHKVARKSWDLMRWREKKQATLGALETAFKKHTDYGSYKMVRDYLDKKAKEMRSYPWEIAIKFDLMPPEEQDAEIERFLETQDAEMIDETMSDAISSIKEEYAGKDPAEMSFDEICDAIREINDVMDKFGAYEPGKQEVFMKEGIFELKRVFMSEWKARR